MHFPSRGGGVTKGTSFLVCVCVHAALANQEHFGPQSVCPDSQAPDSKEPEATSSKNIYSTVNPLFNGVIIMFDNSLAFNTILSPV